MSTARNAVSPAALVAAAILAAGCSARATGASAGGGGPTGPAVTVTPAAVTLLPNGTASFHADAVHLSTTAVTWALEPAGCGALTPAGVDASYVAPGAGGTTCTVRARSVADTSVSGTATVSVVTDLSGGAPGGGGTDYHVGPGQTYASLGAVPWYQLGPGDTVYVHHRATPYREKFLISGQGTASQWIRVRGVPGPNGELPVISGDGATTSNNMHWRWQDPQLVQWDGVISIAPRTDDANGGGETPAYVEIAGLQVQDGGCTGSGTSGCYTFTAENGASSRYEGFAACVYARSVQHLLVRDNVLTNCGQGFYNWTGSGADPGTWWDGLASDITLRHNYFYNNGYVNSYTEHQIYTEANGVVIEGNRFGAPRSGMMGNQIKDRSAGTVVRYNWIEQSPSGYDIDLVEPEAGCPSLCYTWGADVAPNPRYLQAFVYGNVFVNRTNTDPNWIHWNEDHQVGHGRALEPNGRLYVYHNTIIDTAGADVLFNQTWGAFDCPAAALPGRIDFRNNIVYSDAGTYQVGEYCTGRPAAGSQHGNFDFGPNWISPTYTLRAYASTGSAAIVSPAGNVPGFVDQAAGDFRLTAGSSALGLGGPLPAAVTSNALGLDLTPTRQYVYPHATPTPATTARAQSGAGADLGAFER